MKKFTGLSKMTAKKIMLDAGAFFVNFDVNKTYAQNVADGKRTGATQGGGSFQANPETRYIIVDGLPENTKGMLEITGWKPTMNIKMLEQDAENTKRVLGAATAEKVKLGENSYTKISPKDAFDDTDYLENVAVATRMRGTDLPVIIVLHNAVSFGGLSWNFADKSETVTDATFNGHYNIGDNDEISAPPFDIYIPDDVTQEEAAVVLTNGDAASTEAQA